MSLIFVNRAKVLLQKIYRLKPFSDKSKLPPDSRYTLIRIHNKYLVHKSITSRDFNEVDNIYNYLCVTRGLI